jgi:CRP-like cAMP-binding protein
MDTSKQLPDHETFYQLLTAHHAGLVDTVEQQRLRDAEVLIVGCGAVGSRAAEHLVYAGIEHLCLADDRIKTERQLARIAGGFAAVGANCAQLVVAQLKPVNPFARLATHERVLDAAELEPLVASAELIVDTLGIETLEDFRARWLLHQAAHHAGLPVVMGFDVGSAVWTLVNDYRDERLAVLGGAYSLDDLEALQGETAVPILLSMMSLSKAQPEVLRETERILLGQRNHLPHSAAAAGLVSGLVAQATIDLLLERPVRATIALDIENLVQQPGGLRHTGRRLAALYSLRRRLRRRRREGRVGVFSPLEDEVFQALRPYMEELIYEAGSVIVRQGDGAEEFYVILEGRVDVEFEERDEEDETRAYTLIAELGPGDYFGEMALLTESPRAASVVVVERCRVLALSRGAFDIYLEESDAAAVKVRGEALARLHDNSTFIGC